MRILLTDTGSGAADDAARTLEHAGHEVVRCTSPGAVAFPCRGLSSDSCPLDDRVDVTVAVRAGAGPEPTAEEMGVTCALRHRIPLVVAGGPVADPFAAWTTSTVDGADGPGLLAAVEEAAAGDLAAHARVAAEEVERRLGRSGSVRARRHGDSVAVTVQPPVDLDARAREGLGIQVAAAVRRFDQWTAVIDVAVTDAAGRSTTP